MKRIIFLTWALLILFTTCSHKQKQSTTEKIKARVFQSEVDQFGYDVYKDTTVIIHQPFIPGVAGNKGFATKEDAQKVADLVVFKLDKGISPPSITVVELDSLKIKTP